MLRNFITDFLIGVKKLEKNVCLKSRVWLEILAIALNSKRLRCAQLNLERDFQSFVERIESSVRYAITNAHIELAQRVRRHCEHGMESRVAHLEVAIEETR